MFKKILLSILLFASVAGAQTYIKGPALVEGVTITVTSGATTTLTKDSQTNQVFTGTSAQTVKLPDATTVPVGRPFNLINKSTGQLTVNDNGSNLIATVLAGSNSKVIARIVSSANGTWDAAKVVVDLSQPTQVSGALPVANGGTGLTAATTGDTISATSTNTWARLAIGSTGQVYTVSGGVSSWQNSAGTLPTIVSYFSGSGTYTPSNNVKYIEVRMAGGGGGGAGSGTASSSSNGSTGGNTTFGTLTASGGGGATWNGVPGAGGAITVGSGWVDVGSYVGNGGDSWLGSNVNTALYAGPIQGGTSGFGGQPSGDAYNAAAKVGRANSGCGGQGGGNNGTNNAITGGGGGGGGYIYAQKAPSVISYSIGAGGAGGGAGTGGLAGAAGGSGVIIITEHF